METKLSVTWLNHEDVWKYSSAYYFIIIIDSKRDHAFTDICVNTLFFIGHILFKQKTTLSMGLLAQ